MHLHASSYCPTRFTGDSSKRSVVLMNRRVSACCRPAVARRANTTTCQAVAEQKGKIASAAPPAPSTEPREPVSKPKTAAVVAPPPAVAVPHASRPEIVLHKVFDAAVDAATDIGHHIRRQFKGPPTAGVLDNLVKGANGKLELQRKTARPVVLVLGSGWAAHSCVKVIDTDMYDVLLVSPRNFFCFTPMLPSTAVGTVEFRSLLEPIRTSNEYVSYLEASCDHVDMERKLATCVAACSYEDGFRPTFEVPYDILVVAVGEQPATFGVPGVAEHCCFMKEITDAKAIRYKIGKCFELAALPGTSDEEKAAVLHFVVVGGGPTGVEFAGTLSDYLHTDLRKKYLLLMPHVRVTLVQSGRGILTEFDAKLAKRAMEDLGRTGVTIRTGARVVQVTEKQVVLKGGERMDYGVCVWSCGNSSRPLVQSIVDQIPEQAEYQRGPASSYKLAVDHYMRVVGARDAVALGDCSLVIGDPLPTTAQAAAQQGAYLAHMINRGFTVGTGGPASPPPCRPAVEGILGLLPGAGHGAVDSLDLEGCVVDVHGGTSCYEARAQALAQPGVKLDYFTRPFEFLSLGIMAYIADDKAAIDTQIMAGKDGTLGLYGGFAYLLWRSVYITKQVSLRNRVLLLFDWLKTKLFGRDLSMF